MFKKYIAYLKDNPEGYWFKRKLYGWGWTPATWQGWAVVGIYLLVVIALILTLDPESPTREEMFMFWIPFVLLTVTLIRISYKKGEKPKWQWGFPKKDI